MVEKVLLAAQPTGKFVTVDGQKYHKTCFVCTTCGCDLGGGFALIDGAPHCADHAKAAQRKAAAAALPGAAAAAAAAVQASGGGAALANLTASGEDRFLIDIKTGEQIFIESGTNRKYRLRDGEKAYEDLKPKKAYGGAASWQTSEVQKTTGFVAAGQGRGRM